MRRSTTSRPALPMSKGKRSPLLGGNADPAQGRFPGEASLYFDGTDDRLTPASSSDFDFSGVVTYRFSIRPTALPASGKTCRIIMVGTNGSSTGSIWSIAGDGRFTLASLLIKSNATWSATGVITTGVAGHRSGGQQRFDGSDFQNGALVAGPGSLTLQSSGANALAIGRDNSVDPVDKFYNGYFAPADHEGCQTHRGVFADHGAACAA